MSCSGLSTTPIQLPLIITLNQRGSVRMWGPEKHDSFKIPKSCTMLLR